MPHTARRSCVECHRRKIKCDKSSPCSYCVRVKVQCRYPPARSSQRNAASSSIAEGRVTARIEGIERTLQSFQQSLSEIWQLVQPAHPRPRGSRENDTQEWAYRTAGNFLSVNEIPARDRTFPPSSLNECAVAHGVRTDSPEGQSPDFHCLQSMAKNGCHPSITSLCSHPTMSLFLWQRYLERVDPVLKMIHAPTVQQQIMELVRDPSRAEFSAICLVLAIFYAVIVTMSADECRDELKGEKEEVLRRHRDAVETSLAQENFLHSSDMTILQAFVLYIICGRFDAKGPDTRKLADIAIAIARKNDMHQDGTKLDLSPLEVEMRRRLWWQIYILDIRTAEDRGCDPTILESAFNTSLPSNVNDSNLHPDMSVVPRINSGKTEMLFSLVRFEGSNFARRMVFSDKFCHDNNYPILSTSQKCQEIDRFRERIESQYLSVCDNAIPLDFVTVVSIRLILVKLKLTVSKPRTKQSQNLIMHESFRQNCVEILERARMLRLFEKGKEWLWLFQTYLEWDALAYLLINLSLVPSGNGVDLAWKATEDIYNYWKSNSDVYLDKRWMHIEELRSQALLAKNMFCHFPNMFGVSPRDSQAGESTVSVDLSLHGESPTRASPCRAQEQSSGRDVSLSELTRIPAQQSQTREDTFSTLEHEQGRVIMDGPDKSQQSEMAKDFLEIPSSGTACQWSTGLFERYFQVLDMEQDLFADAA